MSEIAETGDTAETGRRAARPLRLAVVAGGDRDGRTGVGLAEWFAAKARARQAFDVDVLDLAQACLADPLCDSTPMPPAVGDLAPWLADADAFVFVVAEVNHGFPGVLKTAIDWFAEEWRAKPVGFVSYGGPARGLRAVEQLRLVFADLHAVTLAGTVAVPPDTDPGTGASTGTGTGTGTGTNTDTADGPATASAGLLLDHLTWWGHALRDARARTPYDVP